MTIRFAAVFFVTLASTCARIARADEIPPSPAAPPPTTYWPPEVESESLRSKPAYTAPFQLRSVIPKSGVRLDTILGLHTTPSTDAQTSVVLLSAQVLLAESIALQARWGIDSNQTGNDNSRTGILNPTLGFLIGVPVGRDFRFAMSITFSAPVATGGGDEPDPNHLVLQKESSLARSAMDNASFSVNDVGFPSGLSFAYIKNGVTAQIDGTVIPTVRVKGANAEPDSSKVNSTFGLFLGYLFVREVSIGGELRYQRYLTTPLGVQYDPSTRDNLTMAVGPRFHLQLTDSVWVRPAVSFARGLRGPVEQQSFQMVQLDVPISF
jgi:hypothetical protein